MVRVSVAGLVALATMGAVPAAAELRFRGAALSAGLTAERRPLGYRVADMTGGAAVGDFNRDGWQDIFLLGGGGAVDALYLNNGDGTFTDHAARGRGGVDPPRAGGGGGRLRR